MKKTQKRLLASLIAAALLTGTNMVADAAGRKAPVKEPTAQLPIIVEADKLYYNDTDGNLSANGSVKIRQAEQTLLSESVRGNSQQNMFWLDESATFLLPETKIVGDKGQYNYKDRSGTIEHAKGTVEHEIVTGQTINFEPEKVIIYNGTMTKCPAKVPDYHISADKVEIWPGEKMIAYNAKVWIKNTVIYSIPKYQKSLREEQSEFPQIGYSSDNGFMIKQSLAYPLSPKTYLHTDLAYYTNAGFKPVFGLGVSEKMFDAGITYGYFSDIDNDWIKKSPEIYLSSKSMRLGDSPVSYSFTASFGQWSGLRGSTEEESWHQDYKLYFQHDPIKLSKSLTLSAGTGLELVKESADHSSKAVGLFDISLGKVWSPKVSTRVGYGYASERTQYFNYNSGIDYTRLWVYSISYQADRLNGLSYTQVYDVELGRTREVYYTWNRDLHCWQTTITFYQDKLAKDDQIIWKLHTKI